MKNPTEPNTPNRAIFYARVSSEGQVDNTSIDTQLDRGRAYAISQGWTLDQIFIDDILPVHTTPIHSPY